MMEKLQRLIGDGPVTAPIHNALLGVIEALDARLGDVEHLLRAHTDNHATAQVFSFTDVKCEAPARMTADEAADIILAEQAKLTRALNDPKLRVWTRAVTALMVGALREHGREDR